MTPLTIALMILFLHSTTWDKMIFSGIKKIIKPEGKLYKPVYGCPICMSPWWGSLIYFLFFNIDKTFVTWVVTILTTAGISVLFVVMLSIREACVTYFKLHESELKTLK